MILAALGPAQDWPALRQALNAGAGPAALILGPRLVAALEDSDTRAALKRALAANGRRILATVLDDAVLPDWTRPYRAALAVGAAELLEDLNTQGTRTWMVTRAPADGVDGVAYLIRVAAFCHDLEQQTRRVICLTLWGAGPVLERRLFGPDSVQMLAGLTGIDPAMATATLTRHVGLARPAAGGLALPGGQGLLVAQPRGHGG